MKNNKTLTTGNTITCSTATFKRYYKMTKLIGQYQVDCKDLIKTKSAFTKKGHKRTETSLIRSVSPEIV